MVHGRPSMVGGTRSFISRRLRSLGVLGLTMAIAAGCSDASAVDEGATDVAPLVWSRTHVVGVEPGAGLDVRDDALVFDPSYRNEVSSFVAGDVLVSGRAGGFVRRVTGRSTEGERVVLRTEKASIADAFDQLQVRQQVNAGVRATNVGGDRPVEITAFPTLSVRNLRLPAGAENQIEIVEGSFSFQPKIDIDLLVKRRSLQRLDFTASGVTDAKFKVHYHVVRAASQSDGGHVFLFEPGHKLAELPPSYITVWAGSVPIVFAVRVELRVKYTFEAAGDVEGDVSLDAHGNVTGGLGYDGTWHDVSRSSFVVEPASSVVDSSVGLTGSLELTSKLSVDVYDAAGPYVGLTEYVDLAAHQALDGRGYFGHVGTRGFTGVELSVFGRQLASYDTVLFDESTQVPFRLGR